MKVAELMTTDVLTVAPGATLKEVAELFAARGISGAPVVEDGALLGVISEADILAKERRPARSRFGRAAEDAKARARTAGEAMTAPAVTTSPFRRVDEAAATMLDKAINRLPVVEADGTLVGIITRADLVRAFVHTDEQIEREIREEVLLHELWVDPRDFELTVEHGEVTIAGAHRDDEGALLARRIRLVPGVVSVTVREPAVR